MLKVFHRKPLYVSEAVVSTPPNTVKANKSIPSKVNTFIAVRSRKRDNFTKTSNQTDNK